MKIEISFLAGLLLVGTDLLIRATVQGVEQAFFSTAIEYGWNAIKTISRFFPKADRTGSFTAFQSALKPRICSGGKLAGAWLNQRARSLLAGKSFSA